MKIRFALVGVGQHARWAVIPALECAQNCTLLAACDLQQENLDSIQDDSVVKYKDYLAMLSAGGFDVVYVATLEDLHEKMVVEAFKAGYHVVCEKPLGMNVLECESMLNAAKQAGKELVVGFEKRYHPEFIQIRNWIKDNRLGKVEAIHIQEMWDMHKTFTKLSKRREEHLDRTGSLDCGIHSFDIIRFLTKGGDWSNVSARGRWFGETDRKQMPHISVMADLDNGVLATITESYAYCTNISQKKRCTTYVIVGTKGTINWAWDGDDEIKLSLIAEEGIETFEFEQMHHNEAIEKMVNDFASYLLGESEWAETLATGEDGLIAQQLVDEALLQTHRYSAK